MKNKIKIRKSWLIFLLISFACDEANDDPPISNQNYSLLNIKVVPSATDPAINTYTNPALSEIHICYFNDDISPRNQLLVFLPGSTGKPNGNDNFDQLAANLGYHVIGLMYPNAPAIGTLCDTSSDPDCYLKTRLEVIDGSDRTDLITVNKANSIENRIIKCIKYLHLSYPSQNWGQFLDANNNIIWGKIAIAGHSQGGGHAALLGKIKSVSRVICLASPKDNYRKPTLGNPQYLGFIAPWFTLFSKTPKQNYYTFTHANDDTGSTPEEQQSIFTAMCLRENTDSISVDKNLPPYDNSRILMTYLKTANENAINPHNCVLLDNAVPDIQLNGINKFLPVWTYMLTN